MRYAKVRRAEIWLRGPKGLERDRFIVGPAEVAWEAESEAENERREAYCDSRVFSIDL